MNANSIDDDNDDDDFNVDFDDDHDHNDHDIDDLCLDNSSWMSSRDTGIYVYIF